MDNPRSAELTFSSLIAQPSFAQLTSSIVRGNIDQAKARAWRQQQVQCISTQL